MDEINIDNILDHGYFCPEDHDKQPDTSCRYFVDYIGRSSQFLRMGLSVWCSPGIVRENQEEEISF